MPTKNVLRKALEAEGHTVREVPRGGEQGGNGWIFEIDGLETRVRMVAVPADESLWKQVGPAGGLALRPEKTPDSVSLVRRFIESNAAEAKGSLLALEANFRNFIHSIAGYYISKHGDPTMEFGFAQVWIVEPTKGWTAKVARRHRIWLETEDKELAQILMTRADAPAGVSIGTPTSGGGDESVELAKQVLKFVFEFATDVNVDLLAAWIYDKLRGRSVAHTRMTMKDVDVRFNEKGEIRRIIISQIRLNRSD